jgi:hypothetical protein
VNAAVSTNVTRGGAGLIATTCRPRPSSCSKALRQVTPGTARHLALVEVVRRLYKRTRVDADRADKERAAAGH